MRNERRRSHKTRKKTNTAITYIKNPQQSDGPVMYQSIKKKNKVGKWQPGIPSKLLRQKHPKGKQNITKRCENKSPARPCGP